jgi:hypothetical protein
MAANASSWVVMPQILTFIFVCRSVLVTSW